MGRPRKATPLQVFEDNLEDAERLVAMAKTLLNGRKYRMRRELRESLGDAMGIAQRRRSELDCVESDDVFVVLKPGSSASRDHFTEDQLRPLLRQAVVAIAASVESYVFEKACSFIGEALRSDDRPVRLLQIPVRLEAVLWIEESFERRGWGHRHLVKEWLELEASPDPDKIGLVFSAVGRGKIWGKVDSRRGKAGGTSRDDLKAIADRRNLIAHTGDRVGGGKASLTVDELERYVGNVSSIIHALDATL